MFVRKTLLVVIIVFL